MRTRNGRKKSLFLITFFGLIPLMPATFLAQDTKPLSKADLKTLCNTPRLKNDPGLIINDFLRPHGIGFLPTKEALADLRNSHIDPKIISELQKPETYSRNMFVRVCHYAAPANLTDDENKFSQDLYHYLHDAKLPAEIEAHWPLLRGIPFDAKVGPVACFDNADNKKAPGKSYVTVSGDMYRQDGHLVVDSIFTYYGLGEDPKPLLHSMQGLQPTWDSAQQIVRAAMSALEDMIKNSAEPSPTHN